MTKNERLNRKLVKWAGFTSMSKGLAVEETGVEYWTRPPNSERAIPLPSFIESLDACFKWLVPKLDLDSIVFHQEGDFWYCNLSCWDIKDGYIGHKPEIEAVGETPSLALCKAIEELIDKEKK